MKLLFILIFYNKKIFFNYIYFKYIIFNGDHDVHDGDGVHNIHDDEHHNEVVVL